MNLLFVAADLAPPPPGGLAWGRYPAPAWILWLVCAATVLGAAAFLILRARKARRRKPASSRDR